jgi:hypothetical protein
VRPTSTALPLRARTLSALLSITAPPATCLSSLVRRHALANRTSPRQDPPMTRNDPRIDRWSPALRRAVMRVCPDFFGWPPERQTRYRVALPAQDRAALLSSFLETLPKNAARSGERRDEEDRLPLPLHHRVNEFLQPLVGIGDDAFSLNELFEEGASILDFPTLRAYDEDCHSTDQRLRAEHDADHRAQPYRGYLHGTWARVLIDCRLCYLTLSMAAAHVFDRIQEAASDEIQSRIPHRYAPGPHDGESDGDLIRCNVRTDAGGHEALLEELQHRAWAWEAERWPLLQKHWTEAAGRSGAYVLDGSAPEDNPEERNLEIVLTDPAALGRVRFETFLSDVRRIEREAAELEAEAAAETNRFREFIAEQHAELLQTFNPKVARLRKRRKVIVHRNAFDDVPSGD